MKLTARGRVLAGAPGCSNSRTVRRSAGRAGPVLQENETHDGNGRKLDAAGAGIRPD